MMIVMTMAGVFGILFFAGWERHKSDERRRRWLEWEDRLASEERARQEREAFERTIADL